MLLKVTPRTVMLSTLVTSELGGGRATLRRSASGRYTIISQHLAEFNCKLLSFAHFEILRSSCEIRLELFAGTVRYVSSAYLKSMFEEYNG